MTHLNYAFGHVNDTFDGVRVDNPERLRQMVALKKTNPDLKVMLSVGGWGSGRFSEMAMEGKRRKAFAKDCLRVVEEFGLDGIDIDWEYPTSSAADISSSPKDTDNFTKLMKELRKVLGDDNLLTLASAASAEYIDFKAIEPYMDFVNIMAYDMANAPKHHSALYESENSGSITSDKAVKAHIAAGMPAEKLVLGMPFYGRGGLKISSFNDYKDLHRHTGVVEKWDEKAMVPYLEDEEGVLQLGYENPRSLRIKCEYALENGLKGAMYWDYDGDNQDGDLRKTVAEAILGEKYAATRPANYAGKRVRFKALLYYSENVEEAHAQFAHQTIDFFRKLTYGEGYSLEVTTDFSKYPYEKLKEYDVVMILRGGGAKLDLACFDDYELAAVIAQYPLPVLTAIGHDQDHHVADMVAHTFVKTPTALADFFLDIYEDEDARLSSFQTRVRLAFGSRITSMEAVLEVLGRRVKGGFAMKISAMEAAVALLQTRITASDPRKVIERGYALALDAGGRVMKGVSGSKAGDKVSMLFADGTLKCEVENVTLSS